MKTKFIHVGKRTLSVVLSIMMIVSTMLIGTITNVSAADNNFTAGNTIYFVPTSDWVKDSGGMAAYFFNSDSNVDAQWVRLTTTDDTHYSGTIPGSGTWANVIFCRLNTSVSSTLNSGKGFPALSYQTNDLSGSADCNCYTLSSSYQWNRPGDTVDGVSCWSNYTLASSGYTYALTGDTNIKSGDTATDWNSADAYGYTKSSSLKFTENNLTVTAKFGNQFRFIGTNGTDYKYYGSENQSHLQVTLGTPYTPKAGDQNTYTFPKDGTFRIEILSGTSSNLQFKVTEVTTTTTDWYLGGTINGSNINKGDSTYHFTTTGTNTYQLRCHFNGGSQYLNLNDGSTTYGPSKYQNGLAENDISTQAVKNGGEKWGIHGAGATDVIITLNTSDMTITWSKATATTEYSVKFAAGTDYTSFGSVTAYNDTTGSSITSGSNVNSGNKVTFTAAPNDHSAYTVGGWYKDASCNSQINSAGTSTTYTIDSVTANTEVYVKFVPVSTSTTDYYVVGRFKTSNPGEDTGEGWADSSKIKFTKSTDTLYKLETNSTLYELSSCYNEPWIAIKSVSGSTSKFYGTTGTISNNITFTDENTRVTLSYRGTDYTSINDHTMKFGFASDYSNTNPVTLCLDVTKPDAPVFYYEVVADTGKYSVKMEQGITSRRDKDQLGSSYLEGDPTKTTVTNTIEDLTVTFTTQTVSVTNPTCNDLLLDYTGYMYQVYGYSILMQVYNDDGTTTSIRTASVVNNLINSSGLKPISDLGKGLYTCEYTFPSNIKSATVTPIFTVSDDYASKKGINFTAVYLKMNPGDNLFDKTYEPMYYTWRAEKRDANVDNGEPMFVKKNGRVLEREPEGAYGGQKMLSVGTDMYLAYVQSDLYGILFDNSSVQTFDYNEFIKLQQLGYNNITFEPKGDGSTETVASTLDGKYKDNGTKVYNAEEQSKQDATSITADNINQQFELDVDIEGYYIDVFGNRLQDTSGNDIKRSALLAESPATTVVAELNALLDKTGKNNKLFGARYGAQDRKNTADDYGMQYAIYNYYVDGTTMRLISQQVSGYGTIEGAIGPNSSSMTNAAYMDSLGTPMTYRVGTASLNEVKNFSSGYELISSDYVGVPYLVSYKLKSNGTRVDGKWYYMSGTPQVTVDIKTSVVDENGNLKMSGGKIVEDNAGGTATLNYESTVVIDQGTSAVMRAYPNYENNYAFVGFYEENGDFISKSNPYSDKVFAIDTTVYAVFKPVSKNTVTVTNNIYRSAKLNPKPGDGNGMISVDLIITPWISQSGGEYVYDDPVTYSGDTSTSSSVSATIKDGDKYQIVLKGKRSGVDEFIAFRIADTDKNNNNLYYIALDDLDCLTVTENDDIPVSATYKTHENVWNWSEHTSGTSAVLDFYTDFRKVSSYATLNYEYQNRDNEPRTYTVTNVPLNYNEVQNGNFVPTDDVILRYAPPIDEVFQNCVWVVTENKIIRGNSVATLTATQSGKTYTTYIDNKSSSKLDPVVSSFNGTIQLTAEETHDNNTFSYWMRYPVDAYGDPIRNSGEIFSYMRGASVKVTFNSYFEAIYGETGDKYFTNVQDPVYTREKYTDSNGTTDYVYADLLVQFDTSDPKLTFADIVKNSNGNIKFGIALERDTKAAAYDGEEIIAPETNDQAPVSTTILDLYDKGATKGWNSTDKNNLPQYNYYYYLYDLTALADDLSAFGRYDYYLRFVNNESNRSKIYNVYSYIIYKDENGVDQIVVSKPTVLSIYATGIKNDGSTTGIKNDGSTTS